MSRILSCKNLFDLPLTNSRICGRRLYICGLCLQKHLIYRFNDRDFSTFVATFKRMLQSKIKKKPTILTSEKSALNKNSNVKRFTELVKVTNNKIKKTKMTVQKITAKDLTTFAEEPGLTFKSNSRYVYDSTRSYDPNLTSFPSSIDFATSENSIQQNKENELIKTQISNDNNLNKSHLGEKTETLNNNSHFHARTKALINSQNLKVKEASKNEEELEDGVICKDSVNVLPLNSLEVFPMPKKMQKEISKNSARAVENLSLPETEGVFAPLFKEKLNLLEPNKEEKQTQNDEGNVSLNENKNILTNNESFNLLLSYVDVAVHIDMPQNAYFVLTSLENRFSKRGEDKNNCVHMFNILLHSYSLKGNWFLVNKILHFMTKKGIKFNTQTYAAIFDCLGRIDKTEFVTEELWKKEVIKHIKNMYADKYTLNDLYTRTCLSFDKLEKILETIREILPFFEIEPTKINLNSQCSLLKDLYSGFNKLESQACDELSNDLMENLIKEQLLIEQNFKVNVKSIYKPKISSSQKEKKLFNKLNEKWRENIKEKFLKELETMEAIQKKYPTITSLHVFLKCLPPDAYVDEMMDCVKNLIENCGAYCPKTCSLYHSLGNKIWRRYQVKKKNDLKLLEATEKLFYKYCTWYINPTGPAKNSRQEWQKLIHEFQDGRRLKMFEIEWPQSLKYNLGKFLYDIIIKEAKINFGPKHCPRFCSAFYLTLRYKDEKQAEEIKCHPSLSKMFGKFNSDFLSFDADQIPMVCPPKPWQGAFDGGYLVLSTDFVRKPKELHSKKIDFKKIPPQKLYATFDSLNALQAVPWIINKEILNIALKVFQSGGSDLLEVPKYPDTNPISTRNKSKMTREEKRREYIKAEKIRMERQNQYGLWCEALYKLSLANHFKDKVFWLPQNCDFRGRVYPVPPHLNHLGSDLFRSFLTFAKGKPLGEKGLDWLKIHTINLAGTHKKNPVSERLKYANEILPEILDSAENPMNGRKWWMNSEEPWQTLAACIEIKKALSSSDPSSYISKLPIHQDGSCNGLQHYAALGKDLQGAISVNLHPSKSPQDVYSDVVEIIEDIRKKDAENGVEIAQILEGFLSRKVVKQTIMTTVYGVSLYGAKRQIAKQLHDIKDFPTNHVFPAAVYLTEKTFLSLKQMFSSAKETQDWFIKCAHVICQAGHSVQWESPLGLPILQPYFKVLPKSKQGKRNSRTGPYSVKQKNAFPPNFIHSLDSTHMMLTAQFCEQQGLTFASIHDCFWTHPETVDVMNKICREQFISLHSLPILQNLSEYFIKHYIDSNKIESSEALETFKSVPKTGQFNLSSVLKSVYFFS